MAEEFAPVREEITVPGLTPAISHYTDAVRFGDLLFLSGIGGVDEHLNVVGGDDVVAQTRHIFKSMKTLLDAAGATFVDILKVTVYMVDVGERTKINALREEYFGCAKPASTLVGVTALAIPGMRIEIEAVVGLRRRVGEA